MRGMCHRTVIRSAYKGALVLLSSWETPPRPNSHEAGLFFDRPVFDRDQCSNVLTIRILFDCCDETPAWGAEAMATAADYRKWAEECFEWARQASDESVREQYASLGRVWLDCAARAELRSGAITPSEPKVA